MWLPFVVVVLFIHNVYANCCSSKMCEPPRHQWSVPEAFEKYQIREDYVPVPPKDLLELKYGDTACRLGNIINPLLTYNPPSVSRYNKGDSDELYTLLYQDIDVPAFLENGERALIGLILVNCPHDDLLSGDVVIPYQPATPAVGTGFHRLLGLVYKQNGTIDTDRPDVLRLSRKNAGFNAVKFAETYGLGDPVAGCFWLAENTACSIRDTMH